MNKHCFYYQEKKKHARLRFERRKQLAESKSEIWLHKAGRCVLDLAIRSLCILGKSFSRGMWKEDFRTQGVKLRWKDFFKKSQFFCDFKRAENGGTEAWWELTRTQVWEPFKMKRSSGVYGLRGGSSKEAEEEMTDRARTGRIQREIEMGHWHGLALNR